MQVASCVAFNFGESSGIRARGGRSWLARRPLVCPKVKLVPRAPRALLGLDPVFSDIAISAGAAAIASGGVYSLQVGVEKGILSSKVNRKIVHTLAGPLLLILWPFYSNGMSARFVASAVPLLFVARLTYSSWKSSGLAKSLSRSSSAEEALGGPLYYVLVVAVVTIFLWKTPLAATAVAQLAFGDGAADLVGRKWGRGTEWPFSFAGGKTIVGSAGFVVAGFFGTLLLLGWFNSTDHISIASSSTADILSVCLSVGFISICCAAAELASSYLRLNDNFCIPVVAALLTHFLIS